MAGLMREQAPPPGEEMPPEGEQMAEGDEEQPNVSPEEQEQYDQFVTNGMSLIHSEESMPQVLETLKGDGNPVEGLSHALVAVVTRLEQSAEEAGTPVEGDIKMHGGEALRDQLVELAEAAGIHEYTPDEVETAFFMACDQYREMKQQDGSLPVDELSQDMNELVAADKEGRLDEIAPGATEYAQSKGGGGGMPPAEEEQRGLMRG